MAFADKMLESLEELRKYANGEYKEADLSDNEREMRIHLEYENRIWGIMRLFTQHDNPEPARSIGTCPDGVPVHIGEDEVYIECHAMYECPYQASSDGQNLLCARETAALALAEQEQQKEAEASR